MEMVVTSGNANRQRPAAATVADWYGGGEGVEAPWTVLDSCARLLASACAPYLSGADVPADAPAIAWLVDNYSFLRTGIRETREMLSRRSYRALPCAGDEPEIRSIARRLVDQVDGVLEGEATVQFLRDAQRLRVLTLAELWAIAPMLRLALFERLRDLLRNAGERRLRAIDGVRAVVMDLHALDEMPWRELTESLSVLDAILREDPARIYPAMDFETRDSYRRTVERIARGSGRSEIEVGRLALELARSARDTRTTEHQTRTAGHVGYYLVGPGAAVLERRAGFRRSIRGELRDAIARWPALFHLGGALLLTILLLAGVARWFDPGPWWLLALLAVPASEAALAIVNGAAHAAVGPRRLPRLDFSDGVPDDCRTLVVVPALLFSPGTVATLVERLEIHYLAERDPNMRFALLTDCADSREPAGDDEELGRRCAEAIDRLNDHYAAAGRPFYLFHRARTWNAAEGVWMGHERKRGKLNDLNAWLLGGGDAFSIKAGDLDALKDTRYVVTLDADTRMPMNAARTLVATAAHPLNRPVFDPVTGLVRDGYAILQPRVSVSAESAARSRLAQLRGGSAGVDPYATAVSDVYQDLYGRASFTGKGLYDLAAFHRALDGRFPDAALLSHDLIEGEHCRVGLVTDVEFVDDYPTSYEVYSKRKHRWTRGDWQLLYWLLRRVPNAAGAWVPNRLSALSRWKIFDNLRRSALEISLALALVCTWLARPDRGAAALGAVLALVLAPAYAALVLSALRRPPKRLLAAYAREKATDLARAHGEALVSLALALHQGALMADAIARTLVRRFVTRRRLLQWETMAQAESSASRGMTLTTLYLAITAAAAGALLVLGAAGSAPAGYAAAPIAVLWLGAPALVAWLNRAPSRDVPWTAADRSFARGLALRTWRYFADWTGDHGLVPDNIQETPERVAHQASPTNIGLQLASTLAAHDFGYLTAHEFGGACERVLGTLERMERHRGHFYNWYDTRTLEPLAPRYVSTVDSGNLAAALLTMKQGSEQIRTQPILGGDTLAGIRDHCVRVRNALPRPLRRRAIARSITGMLRHLDRTPEDVFAWSRLLADLRVPAIAVREWLHVADRPDVVEAADWAVRLVDRIESLSRELRRWAPWAETTDGTVDLPAEMVAAIGGVPTPAAAEGHYDAIEQRMRTASMTTALWRQASRMLLHVGRARLHACEVDCVLRDIAQRCDRLVEEMDFAFLFDRRRKLLHIGYSPDAGTLDASFYDLLASEARTAVFLAIAKREIPPEAWFHLGRKLRTRGRRRALVSWGGTMFEHVMPSLFMKTYDGSLLEESIAETVRIQQDYARERGVPWGFSEAAHAGRDEGERYQYRTFGVPDVAMRKMADTDLVVAPYATMLATMVTRSDAVENLRLMASKGWIGRFGFYESVDYTRRRSGTIVRAFMAHHQGMSLVALANSVLGGRMQARFHADPLVAAAARVLQERIPMRLPADEFEPDRHAALPVFDMAAPARLRRAIAGASRRLVVSQAGRTA